MNGPIAIITGASSGFGLLTALELARSGFQVIATMRNTSKSLELLKKAKILNLESRINVHELDVTSETSITNLQLLLEKTGRVDVLVNNAGYAGAGFVEEITMDEYRKQFETNVFGVIAVTKAVLPLMRRQGQGKIINVSSISGKMAFPGLSPYVASKHAIEGWSESLRLEMKPFGIDVVLIEPGSYKTNIWSTGKQITELSLQSKSPYYKYMRKIEDYIQAEEGHYGDPQEVAKKVVKIAMDKNPTLRFPIGSGVNFTLWIKNQIPWKQWEKIVLKKLKIGK
ncbi:oxidoreductase [Neobacillus soli]|uniref:oxidoreductase n=1 Tax=Neobacillus soli TaxID=220688 RepID=UPI00082468DB|nr:oxidoreductase [Neobacillus soli]